MQIFIDSANIGEIEKWFKMGVIDGVTTNSTIMLNDGVYDIEVQARQIATFVDPSAKVIRVSKIAGCRLVHSGKLPPVQTGVLMLKSGQPQELVDGTLKSLYALEGRL